MEAAEAMITADGQALGAQALERGRSPDVALAILGVAIDWVLNKAPAAKRKELWHNFRESLGDE